MSDYRDSLLELVNVGKIYDSNNTYTIGIRNINLKFNFNEFVIIEGESGSGKSTLLNVISANDTYEEGEIYFKGSSTSHYTELDWDKYRSDNISFIFQDFNIIENLTVLENVELALHYIKDLKERKNKAIELVDKVGLHNQLNQKTSKLSGGEKQRTVIARALAKDSPIMLADEPTGNLDSKSSKEIAALLNDISKNRLVIVVTHNSEYFDEYATRKIHIHDGGIISDNLLNKAVEKNEDIEILDKEIIKNSYKKNILWLGILNYKSRPKFTILMTLILVTFSILLFFLTSIFQGKIFTPLKTSIFEVPINGKVVIKKSSNNIISKSEYKNIVKLTGPSYGVLNANYSEIKINIPDSSNLKSREIMCVYDPYRYDLKSNELYLEIPYSLSNYEQYIKEIFLNLGIGIKNIKVKKTLKQDDIKVYISKESISKFGKVLSSMYTNLKFGDHNLKVYKYVPVNDLNEGEIRLVNLEYWATNIKQVFLEPFGVKNFNIIKDNEKALELPGLVVQMNKNDYNDVFASGIDEGENIALYFQNNKIANKKLSSLPKEYFFLYSSEKVYIDKAGDVFVYNTIAYIGLIVVGILLGILLSLIFSKNVGVLSNDFVTYRTLGISRKESKSSLYIQMLLVFLPNIIILPLVSLIATILPGSTIDIISPVNYIVIQLTMLAIVQVVAFRFNKKIFRTSIRQSLSRGSK